MHLDVRDRLIVALDSDASDALALAQALAGHVGWVKVGMTLFYEAGPEIVREFSRMGFQVFIDLKLHDIPHQVEGAARQLGALGAGLLTVHASGGPEMVAAARRGSEEGAATQGLNPPSILAVTVLTSMDDAGLAVIGIGRTAPEQVELLATGATAAGAHGVVCSPEEAGAMRGLLGDAALIVTPGVRPVGADRGDQSRVATPSQAMRSGSSHLVIGRPITAAPDPLAATAQILDQMKEGLQ